MSSTTNLHDLLSAVIEYKPKGREKIAPVNSVTGTVFGYTTVDSEEPAQVWAMFLKQAKTEALVYEASDKLLELMSSYMGRVQLIAELRSGVFKLRQVLPTPVVVVPVQHYIPSL